MTEVEDQIHSRIAELCQRKEQFALITVVHTSGSTPRKAGTRALVFSDGTIFGTIGGGIVEAEAKSRGQRAMQSKSREVFVCDMTHEFEAESGPICGGTMKVLVDGDPAAHAHAFCAAAKLRSHAHRCVLVTVFETDPRQNFSVYCLTGSEDSQSLPEAAAVDIHRAMRTSVAELFIQGTQSVFLEPLSPPPLLVIVGAGHVGQAVALQAALLGFRVAVVDDRSEFATATRFPAGTSIHCGGIGGTLRSLAFDENTFVVIVNRAPGCDAEALEACLRRPLAYIGMIGSRRKIALLRADFIGCGKARASDFDRIHAPIGLDIGAETVPEIATSILAEIVSVRRNRKARSRTQIAL